jgi:hypothetical protein
MLRKLLIHLPTGDVQEQVIGLAAPLSIGSSDHNTIVIRRPNVASRHCDILVVEGRAVLVNLGPGGQTLVNGTPVQRHTLYAGDRIQVGPIAMEYREAETPEQWASAPPTPRHPTPPPTRPGALPRRRWHSAAWAVVLVGIVGLAAAAVHLLRTGAHAAQRRERARIEQTLTNRQFKAAADLARKYVERFGDAPDRAALEETAAYADIRDRLQTLRAEELRDTETLIRAYDAHYPQGAHREALFGHAASAFTQAAAAFAERAELTAQNLAQAENLLGLAANWSGGGPQGAGALREIESVRNRIAQRREDILYSGALEALRTAYDAAVAAGSYATLFDQLDQVRARWPGRKLPDEMTQIVASARAAESGALTLHEVALPEAATRPAVAPDFVRRTVRIQYSVTSDMPASAERYVVVHGSTCYALDAGSGRLAWSQPVRHPFAWAPLVWRGADVVITGDGACGLAAWRRSDGVPLWNRTLGATLVGAPFTVGENLYTLTAAGNLLQFSRDGQPRGGFTMACPFRLPGTTSGARWCGISADGTLFILDLAGGRCERIEHRICLQDWLRAPPKLIGRLLLVVEGDADHNSTLRVLRLDGENVVQASAHSLNGWVYDAPLASSGIFVSATDRGKLSVFGCNTVNLAEAVFRIADCEVPVGEAAPVVTGLAVDLQTASFWVVSDRVYRARVDLMEGRARVEPRELPRCNAGIGGTARRASAQAEDLFCAALSAGSPSLVVTRIGLTTPLASRWQTVLGEPWYPVSAASTERATFLGAAGDLFDVALSGGDEGTPVIACDRPSGVRQWRAADVFATDEESQRVWVAYTARASRPEVIECYSAQDLRRPLWTTGALPEPLATPPLRAAGVLLVLLRDGRVALCNADTGRLDTAWAHGLPHLAKDTHVAGPVQLAVGRFALAIAQHLYTVSIVDEAGAAGLHIAAEPGQLEGGAWDLQVDARYLYLADMLGQVLVYDRASCDALGAVALGHGVRLQHMPGAQAVVAYAPTGLLACLAGTEVRWTAAPPESAALVAAPFVAETELAATFDDGSVMVRDTASGRVVESYRAPLRWSAGVRLTATHVCGVSETGEVWTCRRREEGAHGS